MMSVSRYPEQIIVIDIDISKISHDISRILGTIPNTTTSKKFRTHIPGTRVGKFSPHLVVYSLYIV